jgi:hypothetical protein
MSRWDRRMRSARKDGHAAFRGVGACVRISSGNASAANLWCLLCDSYCWLAERRRQLGAEEGRRWGAGTYAVPFICAISDTSPTSKLNVTFLQICAIEPQYARRSREQPTAAYNCRSVGICAMLVGSVPVKRFSLNSLPGRHQCNGGRTKTDRAWATYTLAMEGIEETKAGNRPVSAFCAMFLRHHALRTPCSGATGRTDARIGVHDGVLRLLRSGDSGVRLAAVDEAAACCSGEHASARGRWGDRFGTACGSYHESTRAHIDESRRSRVMASGNWPVKFCALKSLQESALNGGLHRKQKRGESGRTCSLSCRCTTGRRLPPAPCRRASMRYRRTPL